METEEALYAAVAEEIGRGEIRPGLWAKALSEEGADEQRAKAKYIKLRVKALRSELRDVSYQHQLRAIAEKKLAMQDKAQRLDRRLAALEPLQRVRSRKVKMAFWMSFVAGWLAVFLLVITDDSKNSLTDKVVTGALLGLFGGLAAGIVAWNVVDATRSTALRLEQSAIKAEQKALDRAKMSWFERFSINLLKVITSAAFLLYLLWQAKIIQ